MALTYIQQNQNAKRSVNMEKSFTVELIRLMTDWMSKGYQFTCFDLTRRLRFDGLDFFHADVRMAVHGLHAERLGPFNGTDYDRYTTNFVCRSGQVDTAELYRLDLDFNPYDPDFHDPDRDDDTIRDGDIVWGKEHGSGPYKWGSNLIHADWPYHHNKAKYWTKVNPNTDAVDESDDELEDLLDIVAGDDIDGYRVDNRGRICVRQSLTNQIGLKPGDFVYLQKSDGKTIVLSTSPTMDGTYVGYLKVDKDGNVRVGRAAQARAGVDSEPVEFTMDIANGSIVLTA